jgi:Tol biopolymer transport system component
MIQNTLPPEPYVGPRPFGRQEQTIFFGRDREIRDVFSLVIAHRTLLLYAPSGAGKTSLINAGVVPQLEDEGYEVLSVDRLGVQVSEDLQPEEIDNIFAFNALIRWTEDESQVRQLARTSLAEFWKPRPHRLDQDGLPTLRILIFDQFEELFTFAMERWRDREKFFHQVNEALEKDPLLRVVFSMREEFIARLDPYLPLLPDRLRTRYRLEGLRREAALAAVKGPLKDSGRSFEKGVAEQLVEDLLQIRAQDLSGETVEVAGELVEPVQLQVVCQSLWQSLPAEVEQITLDDLKEFGDVDHALADFYHRAVRSAAREAHFSQGKLRTWFERSLITPAGTRSTVYRGRVRTGDIPNEAVDELARQHVIRGEWRAGARWYELTHDRFIGPILRSNREWWEARRGRFLTYGISILVMILLGMGAFSLSSIFLPSEAGSIEQTATEGARSNATQLAMQSTQSAQQLSTVEVQSTQSARSTSTVIAGTATAQATQAQIANATATAQAVAQATESADLAGSVTRSRVRPLRPGLSVSGASTTAGTLGAFVLGRDDQVYLLTLGLLLSPAGCEPDLSVIQPGRTDGGQLPGDLIGKSARCLPLQDAASISNMVALVRLEGALGFETSIPGIGPLQGVRQPAPGDQVRMLGRSSGLMSGKVTVVSVDVNIGMSDGVSYQFTNAIETTPMTAAGDGGALVVDDQGYAVGIAAAQSERLSVLAPMQEILDSLDVQLIHQGTELSRLREEKEAIWDAAWSPDGRVAYGSYDGAIYLWDLESGEPPQILKGHGYWVNSLAWSSKGQLASGSRDPNIILWDLESGEPAQILTGHHNWVSSVAWSQDGRLASGDWDGMVIVWDLERGVPALTLPKLPGQVLSLAWSPDGEQIVTAGKDAPARIWDATTGKQLSTLPRQEGGTLSASFSPDGTRIAAAGGDGTVILWELKGAFQANILWQGKEHTKPVRSVAWSPDGKQIVTASEDGTVRIWDAETGEALSILEGHRGEVFSAKFSPEGTRILTAGQDGTVRVWQGK